jgi:hypothetical protein
MAMWRVRKKLEGGKYETIFESRERNDALAQFRAEYRLLLESQPHYTRDQIDSMMGSWDLQEHPSHAYWYNSRQVSKQAAGVYLRLYKAEGKDAEPAVRPTRTEALDKILGIV